MIKLNDALMDTATQARAQISEQIVIEYAEAMKAGEEFPPIRVVFDGFCHYVADGFHRIKAAQLAGLTEIDAVISDGGLREAMLIAVGANASHGLRRTLEDRRKAVRMLISDDEWGTWSDREIATTCRVSRELVAKVRKEAGQTLSEVKCNRGGTTLFTRPSRIRKHTHLAETSQMADEEFDQRDVMLEESLAATNAAYLELQVIQDRLTAALAGGDDGAREEAAQTLAALRNELRQAEIKLDAITGSRNSYQSENCELMQQIRNREQFIKKLKNRCTCGAFDG
jgi:ParB-like chromosome segregation protein Spo0J